MLQDGCRFLIELRGIDKPIPINLLEFRGWNVAAHNCRAGHLRPNNGIHVRAAKIRALYVFRILAWCNGQGVAGLQGVHALLDGQERCLSATAVVGVIALFANEVLRTVRDTHQSEHRPKQ